MDIEIMTLERQFKRGAEAARNGESPDSHCMNLGALGIETFKAGYDHVLKLRAKIGAGKLSSRAEP